MIGGCAPVFPTGHGGGLVLCKRSFPTRRPQTPPSKGRPPTLHLPITSTQTNQSSLGQTEASGKNTTAPACWVFIARRTPPGHTIGSDQNAATSQALRAAPGRMAPAPRSGVVVWSLTPTNVGLVG